jgi:hypothetical protein
LIHP